MLRFGLLASVLVCTGCFGSCDPTRHDGSEGGASPVSAEEAPSDTLDLGPLPDVPVDCMATSPEAGTAPPHTDGGEWLQFRRDRGLSGRSPLVGRIDCPRLRWAYDLGARESFVLLEESDGDERIAAPLSDFGEDPMAMDHEWFLGGLVLDLGDGMWTDGRESDKIADLVAGGGLERLTCQSFGSTDPAGMPCHLQTYVSGDWETLWQSAPLPTLDHVNAGSESPIAGDFDADGEMEAAFRPWNEVVVMDLATGAFEQRGIFEYDAFVHNIYGAEYPQCPPSEIPKWPHTAACFVLLEDRPYDGTGRGYGWFGAVQLDASPALEFVLIGIAEQFVSVLGYEQGQLVERWKYRVNSLAAPKAHGTSVVPAMQPIGDVDGDGRAEIVVSVFNETNDGRWHVLTLDAQTGEPAVDLPDAFLSGLGDLDGDDVAEIFVTHTTGELIPAPSAVAIYSFAGRVLTERWQHPQTSFVKHRVLLLPESVNVSPDVAREDLLLDADGAFYTEHVSAEDPRITTIERWRGGDIERVGSITGPALEIASVERRSGEDGVLFRVATTEASLSHVDVEGMQGDFVLSRRRFGPMSGAVVGRLAPDDERPTVVIEQAPEQVLALQVADDQVSRRWVVPGRGNVQAVNWTGQHQSPFGAYESIVLADVMGDGGLAALVAASGPEGQARLSAYDATGAPHWHRDFATIRGGVPDALLPGLSLYSVGRFSDTSREDVLVQFVLGRRDEIEVIDGRDGQRIWQRDGGGTSCVEDPYRAGGMWMAPLDTDDDGIDELLSLVDRQFVVFDGNTGDVALDRVTWGCWQHPHLNIFDDTAFVPMVPAVIPVVMDLHSQPGPEVLYGSFDNGTALLDITGEPLWFEPTHDIAETVSRNVLQSIGDFDGDGAFEILDFGYCQGGDSIRARSAETGEVVWSLQLDAACEWKPTTAAVADIDGDGRDEAVFGVGFELYAIGTTAGIGEVRFRAELPGIAATPIIADADGSGAPQILVGTDAGYLVALGE